MEFHEQHAHKKQVKTLVAMQGRFDHDARPFRNRRSAELDLPGSEPPFVLKNATFRASAISQTRTLYATSFQNAC